MRHTDPQTAYAARAAQIRAKLALVQQLANNHFGHGPAAVHWGHVGDLGRADRALENLLSIFGGQPSA